MGYRIPAMQCMRCKHNTWKLVPRPGQSPMEEADPLHTCDAFPGGIPDAITINQSDHRRPFPGDNGIRWEPDESGVKHPLDKTA
jgi:hypothetical protein